MKRLQIEIHDALADWLDAETRKKGISKGQLLAHAVSTLRDANATLAAHRAAGDDVWNRYARSIASEEIRVGLPPGALAERLLGVDDLEVAESDYGTSNAVYITAEGDPPRMIMA